MAPSSPSPPAVVGSPAVSASASAPARLDDHDDAVLRPRALEHTAPATATTPPAADTRDTDTITAAYAVVDPGDIHRCFICLEDKTPADDWVTPCKCSLEGHQRCMLSWVADLEAQAKAVKCPLCQSRIEVLDRFDAAIYLSDTMMAYFSNMSPLVLVSLVSTSTLLSSAFYGMHALEVFAGPGAVMRYVYRAPTEAESRFWDVFVPRLRESVPFFGLGREKDGSLGGGLGLEPRVDFMRFLSLSLVGPALVLNRIYFGNIVLIPTSLMYAVSFVDQRPEEPAWPPSPQRVLALFPVCKAFYSHVYKICAKQIAKKTLNAPTPSHPGGLDVQAVARAETHAPEAGGEGAIDELAQPEVAADVDVPDAQRDQPVLARPPRADDALGSLINYFAGAFLWPSVSYGMGRLLQLALPKAWVNRSHSGPSTGLLQERWGRSLVGGCLLVVLKDAFFLYVEYRRALNRPYRSIRSANRRDRG